MIETIIGISREISALLTVYIIAQIVFAVEMQMKENHVSVWQAILEVLGELLLGLFQFFMFVIFILVILIGPDLLNQLIG